MPKISSAATVEIRVLVRERLEGWFPWTSAGSAHAEEGRANMERAKEELGMSDTQRRYLADFCYKPRSNRLTEAKLKEIVDLLSRRDPTFGRDVDRVLWSEDGERTFRSLVADQDADWAANANPMEIAAMERETDDGVPKVQLRDLPRLRDDQKVWRSLTRFRTWAEKQKHNKWIVLQCISRILGPLTAKHRTGFLPGWEDLRPPRRLDFIKASIEREKILLEVGTAFDRAIERRDATDAMGTVPLTPDLERLLEKDAQALGAAPFDFGDIDIEEDLPTLLSDQEVERTVPPAAPQRANAPAARGLEPLPPRSDGAERPGVAD